MNNDAVDALYESMMATLDGYDYESIMVVLGAIHNTFALMHTTDPEKLKELYTMMGNAAAKMAILENIASDDYHELQATKDAAQKKKRKSPPKKARNGPGPFGPH